MARDGPESRGRTAEHRDAGGCAECDGDWIDEGTARECAHEYPRARSDRCAEEDGARGGPTDVHLARVRIDGPETYMRPAWLELAHDDFDTLCRGEAVLFRARE